MKNQEIKDTNENKINSKFASKLVEYILANNLKYYICDHLKYINVYHGEYVIGPSNGCDWMNRYRIDYSVRYYYDDTPLCKKQQQISYDEFDYIGTKKKPIDFNIKIDIPVYSLLNELKSLDMSTLSFIANKLGLSDIDIKNMINDIYQEELNSERLKKINKKISQITTLKNQLQSIKEGLALIEENTGKRYNDELFNLTRLTQDIESYISKLENEIQTERESILRLK